MQIIAAILLIAVAAYAANVTRNIDAVGWVLLGAPFVIPVGMLVLWLTGKLFGALFGGTRRD
ncbi:hypothetical protein T8K17_22890 [Thalassobaculum sp. OXR-137]|uniref:hypothetical protein n=1 Tax=Thalassobaculum sp. OXR-137 TaxID=3100173 RepID=UPI002AC966F4|nr:hypothetical protein [Thalassobaculum sp. OXR-137]WPZ34071.1 hypothetical protein T8K17_22890 [Thalassobaculum sp. OXR-137]